MKTEDLSFFGSDPGAVKFGNFINYYSFHSAKQRINNLHPKMFPPCQNNETILCLDIGCNTGQLTKEFHEYLKTIYPTSEINILAVDIDQNLIQRAQEAFSQDNISFVTSNIMTETDRNVIKNYLHSYQKQNFDITFCFSVTMWIHLNNGDEGLQDFLKFIKDISRFIIVEPQPWNCYRNAQRRIKKSGSDIPLYDKLKIRSNIDTVIENIITESTHIKVYESPKSSWNRKIQSFQMLPCT